MKSKFKIFLLIGSMILSGSAKASGPCDEDVDLDFFNGTFQFKDYSIDLKVKKIELGKDEDSGEIVYGYQLWQNDGAGNWSKSPSVFVNDFEEGCKFISVSAMQVESDVAKSEISSLQEFKNVGGHLLITVRQSDYKIYFEKVFFEMALSNAKKSAQISSVLENQEALSMFVVHKPFVMADFVKK